MKAKDFNPDRDLDTLLGWWREWNAEDVEPERSLSPFGAVVFDGGDLILAGFLYPTMGSQVAFIERLVARPGATPAQTFEGYSEYEAKVLKDFFEDGRLTTIPSQRKKRLVILKYILAAFEAGKRYSEKDVNERIRAFHDDCATIRREFIMNKMMERKAGYYWRID